MNRTFQWDEMVEIIIPLLGPPSLLARSDAPVSSIFFVGPQEEKKILAVERALDMEFPASYKEFLKRLGAGGSGEYLISGIKGDDPLRHQAGLIYHDTMEGKQEHGLPDGLIVISRDNCWEFVLCLDCRQIPEGTEPPVVFFDVFYSDISPYSPDFFRFFHDFFTDYILPEAERYSDGL